MVQDVDKMLNKVVFNVVKRRRHGVHGGKYDRNRREITHRFGKNRRIVPISDLFLKCRGKTKNHHYYCPKCWAEIKVKKK